MPTLKSSPEPILLLLQNMTLFLKLKGKRVEVYLSGVTNKFFTVTGNVYQQGELVTEDDVIKWLIDTYMKEIHARNFEKVQRSSPI